MSKDRKSRILASMLCASVMAGLYAGPTYAAEVPTQIVAGDTKVVATDTGDNGKLAAYVDNGQVLSIDGKTVTVGAVKKTQNIVLNGANFAVTAQGAVSANGAITSKGAVTGNSLYVKDKDGATKFSVSTTGATTINSSLMANSITSKGSLTVNGAITGKNGGTISAEKSETSKGMSAVNSSGVTNTAQKWDADQGKFVNAATSSVTTTGVTNTAYDESGKAVSTMSVSKTSASLKSGTANFTANANGTVSITGTNFGVTTAGAVTANGAITSKGAVTGNSLYVKDKDGETKFSVSTTGATTINSTLTANSITSKGALTANSITSKGKLTVSDGGSSITAKDAKDANKKATSSVTATGVTDTVYGADGIKGSSSVTATRIDNSVTGKDGNKANMTVNANSTSIGATNVAATGAKYVSSMTQGAGTTIKTAYTKDGVAVNSSMSQNSNGLSLSADKVATVDGVKTTTAITANGTSITSKVSTNDKNDKSYAQTVTNTTGVTDTVYGADGKVAASNKVTNTGIETAFGTVKTTTNANGVTFSDGTRGQATVIKGGVVTTNNVTTNELNLVDNKGNNVTLTATDLGDLNMVSTNTQGIERTGDDKKGYTTTIKDNFAVKGADGSFHINEVADGKTMIYTKAKDGTNTMWLDPASGNFSTVGTIGVGGLGDDAKTFIDGQTGSIAVGGKNGSEKIHLDAQSGDIITTGTINGATITKDTFNGVVFKDGGFNSTVLSSDGRTYNRIINTDQGTLISADRNTMTVDKNYVAISKAGFGTTAINGGNITATGTINGATIDGNTFNGVDVTALSEGFEKANANVAGIVRENETTTIEGTTSINKDGLTVKAGSNGLSVTKDYAAMNSGDSYVVVNENGTVFENGSLSNGQTLIDGGNITATGTINGASIKEDTFNGVGLKDGNVVASSITAANGAFSVKEDGSIASQFAADGALVANKDGFAVAKGANSVNVNEHGVGLAAGADNQVSVTNNGIGMQAGTSQVIMNSANGAVFRNGDKAANGETVINGGNITATGTINGATIDGNTFNGVDVTALSEGFEKANENVAGITRRESAVEGEYVTKIEGKTMIASDGTFSTASGMFKVDGATGAATFGGAVNLGAKASFTSGKYGSINLGDFYDEYRTNVEKYDEAIKDLQDKTQNINKDKTEEGHTQIDGDLTVGDVNAGSGNINAGNVNAGTVNADNVVVGDTTINKDGITSNKVTVGETTIDKDGITSNKVTVGDTTVSKDSVNVGGKDGATVSKDGVTVGGENGTSVSKDDVVINKGTDKEVSLSNVGSRVDNLEQGLADANSRIDRVDEKIDKVGAMAAAIANLRTMGYDPEAPTEIAVGVGQYRSETGAALGFFHYPNRDFMLSMSVSTSGDEVMGGIGATWKFGRKTPAEMKAAKERAAEKAKLEKAAAIKKAAELAKVEKQQQRHSALVVKAQQEQELAELAKAAELKKAEEQKKVAELKKAEEQKKVAELKKAEDQKKADELAKIEKQKSRHAELAAKKAAK